RHYWPVTLGGEPLRYHLPDPRVPGPIRVALRALGGRGAGEPIKVAIHTDVGERQVLTFIPGGADVRAQPVDAPGPVSGEVTLTCRPPRGAHELGPPAAETVPIVASVGVRRYDDPMFVPAPVPAATASADVVARLAAVSRRIAERPDAADALVERAHLLLDLD